MKLEFGPRGILQMDEARIIFRNFSGLASKFNREGDRNFAVIIPTREMCNALLDEGWNVKIRPARDEGEEEFMYLPVKVKFNDKGPRVFLKAGNSITELDEETVGILDDIDIANIDMDIRPYRWTVNNKEGVTAYLQSMEVTQEFDRIGSRHLGEDSPF